jgi:hypothetical protein
MFRNTISSMSEEKDKNLIDFIATTVESMRDRIDTMGDRMATKEDLAALKDQMATKRELAALKDLMATKADVARIESNLTALKEQMATKADLAVLKDQVATKNDVVIIRGDIEQVQIRLDSIDHLFSGRMGQIESQISRLRSVIYLLVRDKPDMLRLLGQPDAG